LKINFNERLENISSCDGGFVVETTRNGYRSRDVLLSIGRRGTPRKLGVTGEELDKVVYRLIDPEQYRNQRVVVVGGGDSALEAAASIAEQPGTTVTLSYRSGAFSRAKEKNRRRVQEAEAAGRLRILFNSNVESISKTGIQIEQEGNLLQLDNDAVVISAGGILPTPFLKQIGIAIETKYGTVQVHFRAKHPGDGGT
jgi:thioredoxin reductase (NADPH)